MPRLIVTLVPTDVLVLSTVNACWSIFCLLRYCLVNASSTPSVLSIRQNQLDLSGYLPRVTFALWLAPMLPRRFGTLTDCVTVRASSTPFWASMFLFRLQLDLHCGRTDCFVASAGSECLLDLFASKMKIIIPELGLLPRHSCPTT